MLYEYECQDCKWMFEAFNTVEHRNDQICVKCGGERVIKLIGSLVPYGTRDSFGIGKEFKDAETGKTIDNWRSWEKAGYRNPLNETRSHRVKEQIKTKIDKIGHKNGKKLVI